MEVAENGDDESVGNVTPQRGSSLAVGDAEKIAPPEVGMVFPSWEELEEYYLRYGKQEGFGIVRANSANIKGTKSKRCQIWTCENYGRSREPRAALPKEGGEGKEVNGKGGRQKKLKLPTDSELVLEDFNGDRKSKKCECPANLYAKKNEEHMWEIRRVVLEHKNHTPSPSKSRFIPLYRKPFMTSHVKRKLETGLATGLKISQIKAGLAVERNGVDGGMMPSERDLRNKEAKERRLKMSQGDANSMLKYFCKMTADNQNFYHMHRVDVEGYLKDILWVDARSRASYKEFGDVVCFDATYLTNQYRMPFANFVGVNHHAKVFCSAVL